MNSSESSVLIELPVRWRLYSRYDLIEHGSRGRLGGDEVVCQLLRILVVEKNYIIWVLVVRLE